MRIALFHNTPSGGAKRSIYEWVRRLSQHHEIDVFTLSTADHSFCDIRPFVLEHRVFDFIPRKLFSHPWGRLNQLQRWRDLDELTRIGFRIAREVDSGNYDVVFANTCIYTFIPTILQFVNIPSVYYLHEPFGRRFTRSIERPYLRKSGWRQILDQIDPFIALFDHRLEAIQSTSLRQTKRLLANSPFTQEQLKVTWGKDSAICHLGVNADGFQPIPNMPKEDFVISVGELSPRKGFDFIVESLGRLPSTERPKLLLACNSVNPLERAYVEAQATQHHVQLRVLTNLSVEELAILYNKAQLCVYAPVLEPFGLVPLEAMSCGTPVIGVREGGVQESIIHEQTGLLIERNPDRFAAAIQCLLSNPELASEYGRQGREHVLHNWTWEQSVSSLEKQLIERAGNQPGINLRKFETAESVSSHPTP